MKDNKELINKLKWVRPKIEKLKFNETLGGPESATVDDTFSVDS
jgi:hypothetical protein